jgi:hypothetical protein
LVPAWGFENPRPVSGVSKPPAAQIAPEITHKRLSEKGKSRDEANGVLPVVNQLCFPGMEATVMIAHIEPPLCSDI